ncbi:hypothetical protein PoB_005346900 [Plakobranchus ocellatus]|uniref:Transposase n=1 Tax=Plakobranchus ocellatus TaxID=259542 RepID=A0AAV4C7B7_9GAST|nr:hypothetical protein PoB_005346900 [Plakobranchus ocellatus]
MTLPQEDFRVKVAATRNTLESLWRPLKTLWSLPGGRQKYGRVCLAAARLNLSTLAQGRITINKTKQNLLELLFLAVTIGKGSNNNYIKLTKKRFEWRNMIANICPDKVPDDDDDEPVYL